MKVTNVMGLPEPLVKAAAAFSTRTIQPGRISVTELIGPPLIRALSREHWDELEEDASDRIWALFGSAVHAILERGASANTLAEELLSVQVGDWMVTGYPDLLEADGTLTDWKVVSVYSVKDGVKPEWEQQLNCYAHLYRRHGFAVKRLQVVAILRDWGPRMARDTGIEKPVLALPVSMWTESLAAQFIDKRLALHTEALQGSAHAAPCTDEERWAKPAVFAVYKSATHKRAEKLTESDAAAEQVADSLRRMGHKPVVQMRPATYPRCAGYCRVAQWCPVWAVDRALQDATDTDGEE